MEKHNAINEVEDTRKVVNIIIMEKMERQWRTSCVDMEKETKSKR